MPCSVAVSLDLLARWERWYCLIFFLERRGARLGRPAASEPISSRVSPPWFICSGKAVAKGRAGQGGGGPALEYKTALHAASAASIVRAASIKNCSGVPHPEGTTSSFTGRRASRILFFRGSGFRSSSHARGAPVACGRRRFYHQLFRVGGRLGSEKADLVVKNVSSERCASRCHRAAGDTSSVLKARLLSMCLLFVRPCAGACL